jgi:hypothetical protein
MTKLFQQKEWLSFNDALRYARSITKDEITEKDLLPILLEKQVPIRIMQTSSSCCVGEDISFGYLFFGKDDIDAFNLHFLLDVDFDELNNNGWQIEDGFLIPLDGRLRLIDFYLNISSIDVRHIGYFFNYEEYDYLPVVLDVKTQDHEKNLTMTMYYFIDYTEQDSIKKTKNLHRLTWKDLITKTHKFRGHWGLDGAFIKPFFNRMAIDKLLIPDAIDGQEVLLLKKENDALKLRVLDLERKLKQRVDIREERTYQNLIIALLDYIKGDSSLGIDAHPYFETETQLIDFIAEKYRDYHGLSKSNLSRKIPQIKESFKKQ